MNASPSNPRQAAPNEPSLFVAFRPEFLDFERGIRVGKLADSERITRILKLALEARFGEPFIIEKYGRGRYWQWIGLLPKANRLAKPLSAEVSFGCAKFFVMVDTDDQLFKCGMQVERGYLRAPAGRKAWQLKPDWDWNRLLQAIHPRSPFLAGLRRLVADGFRVHAGTWEEPVEFRSPRQLQPGALKAALEKAAPNHWAGFQVYYPMTEQEVRSSTGADLIEAMMAIFDEVTPLMNQCMQTRLEPRSPGRFRVYPVPASPGASPIV